MNHNLENIIEDVERMLSEGKSRDEIFAAFPHDRNDLEEYFFVTDAVQKRKNEIIPPKVLLTNIVEQVHIRGGQPIVGMIWKLWMPSAGALVAAALLFLLLWDGNRAILPPSTNDTGEVRDGIMAPPSGADANDNKTSMMSQFAAPTDVIAMDDILASAEREQSIVTPVPPSERSFKTFEGSEGTLSEELSRERKNADTNREELYARLEQLAGGEEDKKAVADFKKNIELHVAEFRLLIDEGKGDSKALSEFKAKCQKEAESLRAILQG